MPKIPDNTQYLDSDGSLRIVEWAANLGFDKAGLTQLLSVDLGPRPVAVAKSPATGQATVSNGDLGADIIRLAAGQGFAPHTHPGDHLLIVIAGQGTITYNGKIYPTRAGQVYMVEGATPHAVGAITDHVILAVGCPHKPIDADDRMTLIEYAAVLTDTQEMHCLICDIKSTGAIALHLKGCPHCPCPNCTISQ